MATGKGLLHQPAVTTEERQGGLATRRGWFRKVAPVVTASSVGVALLYLLASPDELASPGVHELGRESTTAKIRGASPVQKTDGVERHSSDESESDSSSASWDPGSSESLMRPVRRWLVAEGLAEVSDVADLGERLLVHQGKLLNLASDSANEAGVSEADLRVRHYVVSRRLDEMAAAVAGAWFAVRVPVPFDLYHRVRGAFPQLRAVLIDTFADGSLYGATVILLMDQVHCRATEAALRACDQPQNGRR